MFVGMLSPPLLKSWAESTHINIEDYVILATGRITNVTARVSVHVYEKKRLSAYNGPVTWSAANNST